MTEIKNELIVTRDINDIMSDAAATYARYINLYRALPDARDGFKPVLRRILNQMVDSKLYNNKPFKKSAYSVGLTMGNYHPHGDSSIYEALVLAVRPWSNNINPIEGHGNFGSIEGHGNAAMRYTEARLSKYWELFISDIHKLESIKKLNYDSSMKELSVLPVKFPNALVNGTIGIGWGEASTILPHNPIEIMNALLELNKKGVDNVTSKDLAKIIKGPDLPTNCDVIVSEKELINEIETGRAKFIMRANIDVIDDKKKPHLCIRTLPYGVDIDDVLIGKIIDSISKANVFNVISFENQTKGSVVNYKINCKPGTSKEKLEQLKSYLYKNTSLETKVTEQFKMVYNGKPRIFGLKKALAIFMNYRLDILKEIWQYDKSKFDIEINRLKGRLKMRDLIDKIIDLAKNSNGEDDLIKSLMDKFDFNEAQAKDIANIKIYKIGKQNFDKISTDLKELINKSENLRLKLNEDNAAREGLQEDFENTLKILKDIVRKSKIITPNEIIDNLPSKLEDLVESTKTKVVIKKDLQIFQMGRVAYNNQSEKYTEDDIVGAFDAMTTDYVIAFTKDGKAVTRFINNLPTSSLDGRPKRLNEEIADLKSTNEFIGGIIVNDDKKEKFFMLTAEGKVKVGLIKKLIPNTNTKGYIKRLSKGMKLKTDTDELVYVNSFDENYFNNHEIHVKLKDESKKSGYVTRKVALSKFKDRLDTSAGAGTTGVNTKKGALPFDSLSFVENKN